MPKYKMIVCLDLIEADIVLLSKRYCIFMTDVMYAAWVCCFRADGGMFRGTNMSSNKPAVNNASLNNR